MTEEDKWAECRFDYRNIPEKCDECGGNHIRYTTNDEVYGKIYGNGGLYLCDDCGAYVGVRDTKNKIPLGRLASKELRQLKMECHSNFDYFWKKAGFKRRDCYGYLAEKLDLRLRETHFGWFDREYLEKALYVLKNTRYEDIHRYNRERNERKRSEYENK